MHVKQLLLRAVFSPHCTSPSTPTTKRTSKDPSVKLLKFADDTTLIGLIQDSDESAYRQEVKELAVWCSLNNLELNTLKTVEMIVTSGETPLLSPHNHHHEQHCDCSGDIQVPGIHHLSRPDLGHSHQFHCKKKSPTKFVLPSPAQEVHPAIWAAETVLLSRHRVSSVHINNCLVWLSYKYKIRHQKTTENGSHCWTDYRCPPAHTPRTVYTQSEVKGSENHSGSLTSKSSPFLTFTIWPVLQSHNYQDS